MLSNKVEEAFNTQINAELYSSYLYLSMSAHFSAAGLEGFASWMLMQSQEELFHATKIFDQGNEGGACVRFTAIEAPPCEWDSANGVFEDVVAHEQKVTGCINDLVDLAIKERDHASNIFLQWFVSEIVSK